MMYRFPFAFERVGKKIFLVHKNVYVRADPDAAIHRAVDGGLSDSIVGTAGVEGQPHPERGSILVNPEGFFIQDIGQVGYIFGEFIKDFKYSFDKENSYFGQLKAFPENSEVEVALHFTSPGNKYDSGVSWLGATIPDNRSFQHVYHYKPFRPAPEHFQAAPCRRPGRALPHHAPRLQHSIARNPL